MQPILPTEVNAPGGITNIETSNVSDVAMEIQSPAERGMKRGHEEETEGSGHKKPRVGVYFLDLITFIDFLFGIEKLPPLKR